MIAQLQLRRGSLALWTTSNPVLLSGEVGFETDTKIIRVGNGVSPFLSLPQTRLGIDGQVIASTGDLSALTTPQQDKIVQGTIVATTDGKRYAYLGTGDVTSDLSYLELGDVSPDWSTITNKPALPELVDGLIPSTYLPSYVDDVIEAANLAALEALALKEAGKIYVALDTNIVYRWSGTQMVEISSSLALGETSATAYRGDRGKVAYDHTSLTNNPHNVTIGQIGAAAAVHTHDGADIVSGVVDGAYLPAATTSAPGIVQLVDSLTSTSTTSALTAKQGKALSDAIGNITSTINLVDGGAPGTTY